MNSNVDDLVIRVTKGRGLGMFTLPPRRQGEVVFRLEGIVLNGREASVNAIQIGADAFIDSEPLTRDWLANHSCRPNCEILFRWGEALFVAARTIKAGEELTWDYETTEFDMRSAGCSFRCQCGSPDCRGLIAGWRYSERLPAWHPSQRADDLPIDAPKP